MADFVIDGNSVQFTIKPNEIVTLGLTVTQGLITLR